MDTVTATKRSAIMRSVRSKNTAPELSTRSLIHRLGYRFRLHRADLPGKPDLVFPSRRKVIFVHGCFWHGHKCPRGSRLPKQNANYWAQKIARNKTRDAEHYRALKLLRWRFLVVWECEISGLSSLKGKIVKFLGEPRTR